MNITALNDFPTIYEDIPDAQNTGFAVPDLLAGGVVLDVDAHSEAGILIVGVNSSHGVWQVSFDGGSTFRTLDDAVISDGNGFAVSNDSQSFVRFVPDTHFHGVADITYRLWDRTNHTTNASAAVDIIGDHEIAVSIATGTSLIEVLSINDQPLLVSSANVSLNSVFEDVRVSDNAGTLVGDIMQNLTADNDTDTSMGLAVVLVNADNGTWQYSLSNGSYESIPDNISASAPVFLPPTSWVRFLPDINFNGEADFVFHAWDGTSAGAQVVSMQNSSLSVGTTRAVLVVHPVNDAPVITSIPAVLRTIPEDLALDANNGTFVHVLLGTTVADVDVHSVAGIAVIESRSAFGEWQYRVTPSTNWYAAFGEV